MASTTHPLLMEKAEDEQEVPQQEAPEEEAAPVGEESDSPVAEQPQEEEDDDRIVLSRKNLFQEFKRLEQEDNRFANILHDYSARKARREYKPKLDELEAKLLEANERLRRESIARMTPDEVKERLASDPKFRQAYDAKGPNPQLVRTKAQIERAVEEALEFGLEAGMDADAAQRFQSALATGWYDYNRDANGNPIGEPLSPYEAISRFHNDVNRYVRQISSQQAAPQKQAAPSKPKPVPNRALTKDGPDLSPSGGSSAGGKSMKWSEYQRLDWKQKMAMFPTDEDVRSALSDGRLVRD